MVKGADNGTNFLVKDYVEAEAETLIDSIMKHFEENNK